MKIYVRHVLIPFFHRCSVLTTIMIAIKDVRSSNSPLVQLSWWNNFTDPWLGVHIRMDL